MTERSRQDRVFLGESPLQVPGTPGGGDCVERDGEPFYRIANFHAMAPFFMSVVSAYDHWLFVSSTGGLTCGRRDPENALFPYCTDDKVHDAARTTGPLTALLVERDGRRRLWRPFDRGDLVYEIERNLYKNIEGNKLVFEEVNRDLDLTFSYSWTTGNHFGFVRKSCLVNTGTAEVPIHLLDGLRNLLPHGVDRYAQSELSTLVDAYKQAELVPDLCAGIFSLSSILTDRAEPAEALKSTIVWSVGLESPRVLLSEDQLGSFCAGGKVDTEASRRGKRGAFFVQASATLAPGTERHWYLLADVEQGPSKTAELLREIRHGITGERIEEDVSDGTARLRRLAGSADGFQKSADDLANGRHFSNTLCNIMRGGVFPHGYEFPRKNFLDFVRHWNRPQSVSIEAALDAFEGDLTLQSARELAEECRDETFERLVYEYLPLTFSRRHGDPSRPWNHFSIRLEGPAGSERLDYQGNWRDIFQNWEALALSFPDYVESFVAKFVNASTADGYNPYRISRDGIDWEVHEPDVPWSNIGYWGDHQIVYLLRLLELSRDYHPGRLGELLNREIFVYADVPYRLKPYREMLADPRDTVAYDADRARSVATRVADIGADGRLAALDDGSIHRVNLLEKLLLPALVKLGNLVPGGGIWMNTQRPEWNDANNALVGHGLSMVTLCYLRRYLCGLADLLGESDSTSFDVSDELAGLVRDIESILTEHTDLLAGPVDAAARRSFMDAMGAVNDRYRARVYRGPSGAKAPFERPGLLGLIDLALRYLDHSLEHGRREDGLYHAYNLLHFGSDGFEVEPLDEMLEGQVAVLSSGHLDVQAALALLKELKTSRLYREDQNSYLLYPDRALPSFLEKNVISPALLEGFAWVESELRAGATRYVEKDVDGRVHFNGEFRNAKGLRETLESDPAVDSVTADRLCDVYEAVFEHRKFTGRSGTMVKYEGLGSVYWHMVSKLLVAVGETVEKSVDRGADASLVDELSEHFDDIQDGLGVHKSPADYGAFTVDPYSHTPGFSGVQQPGLTGQVKEDVIARFMRLGVRARNGEVAFEPVLLDRDEFLHEAAAWSYSTGGPGLVEELPAGSLAFTLCGVPVVYRLGEEARVQVFCRDGSPTLLDGSRLGRELSGSLFRREGRVTKLVVELPADEIA